MENSLLMLENVTVTAMGRETREFLEEYGVKVALVPEKASAESMVRMLVSHIEG
jgi:uroporphyrinogen-III synthase